MCVWDIEGEDIARIVAFTASGIMDHARGPSILITAVL